MLTLNNQKYYRCYCRPRDCPAAKVKSASASNERGSSVLSNHSKQNNNIGHTTGQTIIGRHAEKIRYSTMAVLLLLLSRRCAVVNLYFIRRVYSLLQAKKIRSPVIPRVVGNYLGLLHVFPERVESLPFTNHGVRVSLNSIFLIPKVLVTKLKAERPPVVALDAPFCCQAAPKALGR
jgi:hypothetical protein